MIFAAEFTPAQRPARACPGVTRSAAKPGRVAANGPRHSERSEESLFKGWQKNREVAALRKAEILRSPARRALRRSRAVLAATLLMLGAESAEGQVELIVRPSDGSELLQLLERLTKAPDQLPADSPLRVAESVTSLFASGRLPKTEDDPFTVFVLGVADSTDFRSVYDFLAARADVQYVQANHSYHVDAAGASGSPDPFADSLAHLAVIGADEAWSVTAGSQETVVGFVDTGVFFDHPDLAGQFYINPGEDIDSDGIFTAADLNGVDDDGNGYVDDISGYDFVDRPSTVEPGDFHAADPDAGDDLSGHGTNVAGIIAAARQNGLGISGVAPGVRIAPIRAFGGDGRGDDDDIARAIVFGAEVGFDVLNLSFGDVYISPLMRDAIRFAVGRGVTVIASAGNVGGERPHYPSDYPEVISVVWLNEEGTSISSRATHGVGIEIGAPGSSIYTTLMPEPDSDPAAEDLYGRRSGSSMAAPMVSAAAALVKSVQPGLSPEALRSILTATARDIGDPGWDHRTGAGLLNAGAAVRQALPARVEITYPDSDGSISEDVVEVLGSAVDPSFTSYDVSFSAGDADPGTQGWELLTGPVESQILNGVLATWEVSTLAEGTYTLRLRVQLRSGRTVEDRRRVTIDRTAPEIVLRLLDSGFADGLHAVVADVETDDLTAVTMEVVLGGKTTLVESGRITRRHGLNAADLTGMGGDARVRIAARNPAGLQTVLDRTIPIPADNRNTGAFTVRPTGVPHGFLLDTLTDFDNDGLMEIVLNLYEDGWLGDTVAVYEWTGALRRAASLLVGAFPRGVGDTDSDGLAELLLQAGPTTIVVEQEAGGYPSTLAFIDTTGLGSAGEALWGARIFDIDGDGAGEIIGHNTREWRILKWNGAEYTEQARLQNTTGIGNSEIGENSFEQPQPLVGDIDRDGIPDMLAGDSDGDWLLYESTGDNAVSVVWTYETDRYDAGARIAPGDFDGDGLPEIATFAHNWLTTTSSGVIEPDIGIYYIFDSDGDNSFRLADTIPVAGEISRHGTAVAADLDADGRDELLLINPPDLYLLDFDPELGWSLLYHTSFDDPAGFEGVRSIKAVAGDVDSDGAVEVLFSGADGWIYLLEASDIAPGSETPNWVSAFALSESAVQLAWRAPGVDSTAVYRGTAGMPLDPVVTTAAENFVDSVGVASDYALRAWQAGQAGPLSRVVSVRPHAPATVTGLRYPSAAKVEVDFSEPLQPVLKAASFRLASGGSATSAVATRDARSVEVEFANPPSTPDTLIWEGLVDDEGTPLAQDRVPVSFPDRPPASLILTNWQTPSRDEIGLTFSSDLDPLYAQDAGNYELRPFGSVTSATWNPGEPRQVRLKIDGAVVGATGLESSLTVVEMRSETGERLAPEGATIRLSNAASDLSSVYLFPNPLVQSQHRDGLMIAGLPVNARVQVFSSSGALVRDLREEQGSGGLRWSLTDDSGSSVPSGIYLIRVSARGMGATLKKAAIID